MSPQAAGRERGACLRRAVRGFSHADGRVCLGCVGVLGN